MPEIQAFRAIRYHLGHVGSLSDVVAPPYDVISHELQDALYRKHPCNVVRLILNRIEPGDDEANNRYTRAARFFKSWQADGVLFTEADPAIYVYHQEFGFAGQRYTRRGFMARMKLHRFGEGPVFPHEHTVRAAKIDRLMLTVVCKANLSQVFGIYPDPELQTQAILEAAIAGQTPIEAVDHLGTVHRMWPVTDVSIINAVAAQMAPKPMFIADGHHRYETACDYRDQVYDSGALRPDHPARYVLTMCVAMEDPGLIVLPTHRLFPGTRALTAEQLAARLGQWFTCRRAGQGVETAEHVWEDVATCGDPAALALFTPQDACWTIVQLTVAGRKKMAELAPDHSPEWRNLGVSVLHRFVVESVLDGANWPEPKYVHMVEEVVAGLRTGEFALAALVQPATVQDIRTLSLQGERLPAKSTYFFPKLLSGLVFNPLEEPRR